MSFAQLFQRNSPALPDDPASSENKRGKWRTSFARLLLAANLLLALAGWYVSANFVTARAQTRFDYETVELRNSIQQRMDGYEQVLRGGIGLFASSFAVTRTEWRTYVNNLAIHERFPGIQGLGFIIRVQSAERNAFVDQVRAEGFPKFDIKPAGERAEYHSVIYLEPFDWRNQRAFGYDMYSHPIRREAMDRARDTAQSAISGIVTLVQETDEQVQRGFLLYLPLYKNGTVPETVAERRADLRGFVYSPFRAKDLMRGIIGSASRDIGFSLFDGAERSDAALLYSSDGATTSAARDSDQFVRTLNIDSGGRSWRAEFYSRAGFLPWVERAQPLAIGLVGFVLSYLLYLFMESMASREKRAHALAQDMTMEVQEREHRVRDIIDSAQDAFISLDANGVVRVCNKAAETLFGWSDREIIGENFLGRLVSAADREKFYKPLGNFFIGDPEPLPSYRWQIKGIHRDGDVIPLELSLSVQRSRHERFLNIFARDTTDQVNSRAREVELARLELDAQQAMTAYKAERKFRAFLESAPDAMVIADSQGKIVLVNGQTEKLFGYEAAELIGQQVEILIPDRFSGGHGAHRNDFLANPKVRAMGQGIDLYGKAKDGNEIPIEISLSPIVTDEGTLVSTAIRDITRRKMLQAEQAIASSKAERKFRAFMESAPDGLVISDRQGQIVLVNRRIEALFGYAAVELIGQPVEILVPDRFRGGHGAHRNDFLANPRVRPMGQGLELCGITKNGKEIPIEISLSPVTTDEGTFVFSGIHDITRQKRLHEDNTRLAEIVRSSNSAMFSISLGGSIQTWNTGAEKLFGYPSEQIIGQPVALLTPPEHSRVWESNLERLRRGDAISRSETIGTRSDGSFVEISISAAPIADSHGIVTGVSLICRDLTERKRTEMVTQKNVDLETLLYVTSHDLREPLRTIESFSRMVIDSYSADLPDKGKDFLSRVLRAATRMNRLLDDILALSRAQRFDTQVDAIAGEIVVRDALKSLSERIEASGAKVTVAQDLPPFRVNPMWATQAIFNLVANALKFARSGEAPEIDIDAYAVDDEVGVVVKDRGSGVEERHALRIFDLFQRAVGREVEGTGAGLAIVKQVAERHGGRAWVAPRAGGGSEFYLTFGKAAGSEAKPNAGNWPMEGR